MVKNSLMIRKISDTLIFIIALPPVVSKTRPLAYNCLFSCHEIQGEPVTMIDHK